MRRTRNDSGTPRGLRKTLEELGADVREALEQLAVPAGVVDASGTLRWANAAARDVLGDVSVGRSFFRLLDAADVRQVREDLARIALGTGPPPDRTAVIVAPNGTRFRAELSGTRLKNGEQVVGVFGIARLLPLEAAPERAGPKLTPRQIQVLRLLATGAATHQIAAELGISVDTTRNHIRRLLRGLDAHSRLQAVVRAYRIGILDDGR